MQQALVEPGCDESTCEVSCTWLAFFISSHLALHTLHLVGFQKERYWRAIVPSATATAPRRINKEVASPSKREAVTPSWVGRVPQLKPGRYADGLPIHSPEYICCKLILHPNKFHSRESFFD